MNFIDCKAKDFRKKAFTFNNDEFQKALKIIDQAAGMGKIEVNISNSDVNNLATVSEMLKRDGFEVTPMITSNVISQEVINITVSW